MTTLSNSIDKEKSKVINIVLLLFNFIIVYLSILLLNLLLFQKSLSLLRVYFTIHDRSYSHFGDILVIQDTRMNLSQIKKIRVRSIVKKFLN